MRGVLERTRGARARGRWREVTTLLVAFATVVSCRGADEPVPWECELGAGAEPASVERIGCNGDFEALASRPLDASIPGTRSEKTVLDRADDGLYFMNSRLYPRHYEFIAEHVSGEGLPPVPDVSTFNQTEYYSPSRRFLLGAVTYYEELDLWTYEIAPYDTATVEMIETAMRAIAEHAYFGGELFFHPTSSAIEAVAEDLIEFPVVTNEEIFAGNDYQPLNLGEAYGQLRFFSAGQLETEYVGPRDVVVLDHVPNDIAVVAGLITDAHQTPLSHVNVLSQNRGTPNMSLRGAFTDGDLRALEDSWVHLVVGAFEYTLEAATREEADAWWEDNRPPPLEVPALDLEVTDLRDMTEVTLDDLSAFGGKGANYGVLSRLGDDVPCPRAFGVPFFYYWQFMEQNGFDQQVAALQRDEVFLDDPTVREQALADLRAAMMEAPVDAEFEALLTSKLEAEYPGQRMRFRSSTNAEDLGTFTGAGLYSSASGAVGDPDRPVLDAVRFVWASLWSFRAYEERTYHGIPQDGVAMALLVHHSFPDEEANGVALTNNIFDETEPAFFINVQVGEFSVVSPPAGVTVDSLLYYYYHPGQPTVYLSHSSLIPAGATVLTPSQISALGRALAAIHEGFAPFYETTGEFYAMDVEFKLDDLDSGGEPTIWIKQARPHPGWSG